MRWYHRLFRKRLTEKRLDAELRFHINQQIADYIAAGMTPEEARRRARLEFGGLDQVKEECRDVGAARFIETLIQDLRYGRRQLRRNPGFTAVVVLSLALGIGANTAIFTVIDAVLLQSLPVKSPDQLVLLDNGAGTGTDSGDPYVGRWPMISYDIYQYLIRHNQSFQGLASFRSGKDPLEVRWRGAASHGQAERAIGHLVSGNYFEVMGVRAALGRVFGAADDVPNARPVAVISYDYWQREFHGDRAAVGRAVDLNGVPFTIVGITPPEFFGERMGEQPPDFWLPLTFQPGIMRRASWLTRKDMYWLNFIGRLKPGVTRARAQAVLDVQLRQYLVAEAGAKPSTAAKRAIRQAYVLLAPGSTGISRLRELYSEPLHILMGIVALVLLVACANVANLLLSRSAARQREIAMRLVVGAGRARLIRQLLTESVLLASFGGVAGLLLADWGVHLLSTLLSRNLALSVTTNPLALAFTLAVSVLTGLVFGLAPAVRASRTELGEAVKSATAARGAQSSLTRGLVVLQVAVSLILLAGAGLLARSLVNLEDQNLGFNGNDVLLVNTDPRLTGMKVGDLDGLYRQLVDRLNVLHGVRSATIAFYSPMSGHRSSTGVTIQGYTPSPDENMDVNENQVAPNYFETLGIPVLLGRPIGPQDTAASPKVVVVNQAFVRRFLHGRNPIGKHLWIDEPKSSPPQQIVGLVSDARYYKASRPPGAFVYLPLSQDPGFFAGDIEIRTAGDPSGAAAEVRQAIKGVDSALPIVSVETLRRQAHDRLDQARLVARLSVLFSLLALILAAVGLYGVMAYWVARRTQEIGIRMALGAQKGDVLRLVVGRGLVVTLIGTVCGLAAALGLTRLMASSLYGVKPTDPLTLAAVSLVVIAVALLASYIPARRATKVDPMVALRYE